MGHYYLYPFFRTLLLELGATPVLSSPTSRATLEGMDVCPTDEPCLAVKLHFSHADALVQRDDIDFVLIPVIAQVDEVYCCPKFLGIGDMVRHGLRLTDEQVHIIVLDYSDNDAAMYNSVAPLAQRLGVRDRVRVSQAISRARVEQERYRNLCVQYQLTTPEAYRVLEHGGEPPVHATPDDGAMIGVIGHPYILYEITSQGMIERLRESGRVVTAEMVDPIDTAAAMASIKEGPRLWPFEAMLLGAALHLLRSGTVEKMILVGSFECGPESIIESYIEEEAHRLGIPLMVLSMDEHSGEAGLVTRLEAFMDTEKVSGHSPLPTPHVTHRDELVIGMPSMGHIDVALRGFVESFGIRTVITPRTTKGCVEIGRELAPEFVCFPFTATLGQMRYMLDHGANALLMVGGKGYCRLGWYAQVQEKLLRNIGHDFEMLIVDSPFPLPEKWGNFRDLLKRITNNASWPRIISRFYTAYQHLAAMDRVDAVIRRLRAYERTQGAADRIRQRTMRRFAKIESMADIRRIEREFNAEVAAVEVEDTNPLRICVVGEIWVVLEQSATRDIEQWLGARTNPRVWVKHEHSTSHWFRANVLKNKRDLRREDEIIAAAKPWLSHRVGGHGQLTVGQTALAREEGADGVLHIFPFTCMPEIIAQNIMVRMAEDMDIPILTYIVSEQMGEAGAETRLESFLDLLEERRMATEDSVSRLSEDRIAPLAS